MPSNFPGKMPPATPTGASAGTSAGSPSDPGLVRDLVSLEQKLTTLIAHTRALRVANEALRRDLTAANTRNHALTGRVAEARQRLDALCSRLPANAE
jgi:chromosome segregation ATPase